MKTVIFNYNGSVSPSGLYDCLDLGDQSGEYFRAEDVSDLFRAAKTALAAMYHSNCDSIIQDDLRRALSKFDENIDAAIH